jgi:hypothetical protein
MTKLSEGRKATYYVGMALTVVGFILFISFFFTVLKFIRMNTSPSSMLGNPDAFGMMGKIAVAGWLRALAGVIIIAVGAGLMRTGALGVAGSGLVLNPDKARDDLQPWAKMGGGLLGDAISESGILEKNPAPPETGEVVRVRCPQCRALNDEKAKFCNQCGNQL